MNKKSPLGVRPPAVKRRFNPRWHPNGPSTFSSYNIYLTISEEDDGYHVINSLGKNLAVFNTAKSAETFARSYRSHLMPNTQITDIRFISNKVTMPIKSETIEMTPLDIPGKTEFVPIDEDDDQKIVEHPANIINF